MNIWTALLDSIAASLFVCNRLSWQIVSDDKIQITILILRRVALSTHYHDKSKILLVDHLKPKLLYLVQGTATNFISISFSLFVKIGKKSWNEYKQHQDVHWEKSSWVGDVHSDSCHHQKVPGEHYCAKLILLVLNFEEPFEFLI